VWFCRYNEKTNGLPLAVLAIYFLVAMTETIPMTAFAGWLNNDIKMTQEMQSNYYAVCFLPWAAKPLYGWISDSVPLFGYHRRSYVVVCGVGSAICFVLLATVVTSASMAYVVTFSRAILNAFNELMIGIFMVDVSHRNLAGAVFDWTAVNGSPLDPDCSR
jgi:hypothetical protein